MYRILFFPFFLICLGLCLRQCVMYVLHVDNFRSEGDEGHVLVGKRNLGAGGAGSSWLTHEKEGVTSLQVVCLWYFYVLMVWCGVDYSGFIGVG